MRIHSTCRVVMVFLSLSVATLSADIGFALNSYMFVGSQSAYTLPSAGADFLWRMEIPNMPLRVGANIGADYYFPTTSSNAEFFLISVPVSVTAAYTFIKTPFILRGGLGLGPYVSLRNYPIMGPAPGVTAFAEPFVEVGIAGNGFELLFIPAYVAVFEFLNPGGTYVHQLSIRFAMMFTAAPAAENKK